MSSSVSIARMAAIVVIVGPVILVMGIVGLVLTVLI